MMRKTMFAAPFAAALSLGGCAGGGGLPSPSDVTSTISQVQQVAVQVCGYLPAAETVASLIAAFTGGGAALGVATQVANEVCAAATAKRGVRGRTVTVRGVVLRGRFVR